MNAITQEHLEQLAPAPAPAAAAPAPNGREDVLRRARAYVARIDPGVMGEKGSNPTFRCACILVGGFGLALDEARPLMAEYSGRCVPPWSEREIEHKLESALRRPGPRGYLLADRRPAGAGHAEAAEPPEPPPPEPGVEPFPVEVFPPALAAYCLEQALAKDVPADLPGWFMLGTAAAAIGASRGVLVKPGWPELPRLFLAVVAAPGMAKTPTLNAVCRPLYRAQHRALHEHRLKQRDAEGRRPPFPCLYTTNATTEKLAQMMHDNPRGFAVVLDEFASLVTAQNQYKAGGKGDDRDFWLKVHGGSPIKVDRKNQADGPIVVPHPFLCAFGGIQPDRVPLLLGERRLRDGLVERVLFSYPAQRVSRWNRCLVSDAAEQAWERAVQGLLALPMGQDDDFTLRPRLAPLGAAAAQAWETWVEEHEREMADPDRTPPELEGAWSKLRGHVARLAAVLHQLRQGAGLAGADVDEDSLVGACALAGYCKSHLRRVHRRLADSEADRLAERVAGWIGRRGGTCNARELCRYRVGGLRRASEASRMLEELEDRGLGTVLETTAANGRQVQRFRLWGSVENVEECRPGASTPSAETGQGVTASVDSVDRVREPGEEG